jgi:hypothetical protein
MDGFLAIGLYLPVKDAAGARPAFDEAGDARERECIPYSRLDGIEVKVDERASGKTRRFVDGTFAALERFQGKPTVEADAEEDAFQKIVSRTVVSLREVENGKVIEDEKKRAEFFASHIRRVDFIPILSTIQHGLELSGGKKKSWSSLFA